MTARIRPRIVVEAVNPVLPAAMAWADEHVDIDRIGYLNVVAAYCAGHRQAHAEIAEGIASQRDRLLRVVDAVRETL